MHGKMFPTHGGIYNSEKSTSILKRDKTLSNLNKYERLYSWGVSLRTRLVNNTVYRFVGYNMWVEIFLKKRKHQKKGASK